MMRTWGAFALFSLLIPSLQAQSPKTVLDRVYTDAQATRGAEAFRVACGRCHAEDQSGHYPILSGLAFINRWREYPVAGLYTFIKENMPPKAQRNSETPDNTYVDILAHILKLNGYPAGSADLTSGAADEILLVGKDGPKPPPDGAVVVTAGCLTQAPNGWLLTNATQAIRNRQPDASTASERTASLTKAAGPAVFTLTDFDALPEFAPEPHKGHKMLVKGYFVWKPNGGRIGLTFAEMLDSICPK